MVKIATRTNYRIESVGTHFIVIDPWGERLIDEFPTREDAERNILRCQKQDRMYETARVLIDVAIKAHMEMHNVDRETARYCIQSAAEGAD